MQVNTSSVMEDIEKFEINNGLLSEVKYRTRIMNHTIDNLLK